EPKEIVARGYDAIALRYAEWAGQIDSPVMEWVRDLDARLDVDADVLELGCGRGVPTTRELARRHRVTGVDISAVQIELARHHVPEASFVNADATELDIAPASLDAVVALFVFGHVPIEEQSGLIARIGLWLRDGGGRHRAGHRPFRVRDRRPGRERRARRARPCHRRAVSGSGRRERPAVAARARRSRRAIDADDGSRRPGQLRPRHRSSPRGARPEA